MLEKTLESPLNCKEIQPVHPKGDQSWVFIGRTDVEAEILNLWPPDAKSLFIWKDSDAGKDWGQEETETTEDEVVGWHLRLDRHGFGWTPGVGDGQGGLGCWILGVTKSRTQLSNWTELNWDYFKQPSKNPIVDIQISFLKWYYAIIKFPDLKLFGFYSFDFFPTTHKKILNH